MSVYYVPDRFQLATAVSVVFFAIIGCSASAPSGAEQVNFTIANLSDASRDPKSFESFFVEGSVPNESQRRRYGKYFYEMDPPDVSKNSATAIVRITNAVGEMLGEKKWVFTKVDTQWKISEAPLP